MFIISIEKRLTLPVTYKEYGPSMNPEGRFQLFVSGTNVSTGRMNTIEESFVLKKPDVMIEVWHIDMVTL